MMTMIGVSGLFLRLSSVFWNQSITPLRMTSEFRLAGLVRVPDFDKPAQQAGFFRPKS